MDAAGSEHDLLDGGQTKHMAISILCRQVNLDETGVQANISGSLFFFQISNFKFQISNFKFQLARAGAGRLGRTEWHGRAPALAN